MEYKNSILTGGAISRYFDFNRALLEFSELFNGTDKNERSIAILGGTFLEMTLEHILYSFFPEEEPEVEKLFEFNQPMGNFSNKIQMAYCLGLIEKTVKYDLNLVRKIRNKFAHDLFTSFEDEKISSWCKGLKWHQISYSELMPEGVTNIMLFQVGVNQLIANLHGHISIARAEKRSILDRFGGNAKR